MPVAISDVTTALTGLSYPCSKLSTAVMSEVTKAALRELNAFVPSVKFGTFTTVANAQDYYIFDGTKPEGCAVGALNVRNAWWNPAGDFSSPDIFSPGFQLFSNIIVFNQSQFDVTADMVILRQKLDAWTRQFGDMGFDLFGQPGDPTSFIRLYPPPRTGESTVLVEYDAPFALSDILSLSTGWGRYYMMWAEVYAAEAIANSYAATAGTEVAGFKDSPIAYNHWMKRHAEKLAKVLGVQGGLTAGLMSRV